MPSLLKKAVTGSGANGTSQIALEVERFSKTLQRLHSDVKESGFMDMVLAVVETDHPLVGIIPEDLCILPCIVGRNKNASKIKNRTSSKAKTRNPSTTSLSSTCDSASDFTFEGSPLKLQEITSIEGAGEDFPSLKLIDAEVIDQRPVSVGSARKILSYYNMVHTTRNQSSFDVLTNPMPLWIVTDARDEEKIAYFGNFKLQNVLKTVRVMCSTVTSGKDVDIKTVKSKHLFCTKSKEYTQAYSATYEVVKMIDPETHESHGSMRLEYEWENAREFLDLPPLDARVKVLTCIKPGDRSSPANQQYKQLSVLKMFSEGLETQHICWAVEENDVPLIDSVKDLFKKCTDPTLRMSEQQQDDTGEDATASIDHLKLMQTRLETDFTEKLWNVLIECTAYQELKESLSYVFTALRRVECLPWISPNNKTKLAQFIIDCDKNSNQTLPHLEGLAPLEILIELGINKLRQDYIEFFVGQEFVQPHDLEFYKDTNLSIPEQIIQLDKLHHALEMFLAMKQHLHLRSTYLAATARMALSYYKTHDTDPDHIFSLSVAAKSVRNVIEGCAPTRWKMKLTSRSSISEQIGNTECMAVSEPIITHVPIVYPKMDENDHSNDDGTIFQLLTIKESFSPIF
ncbi:protein zwilch homolog [Lineus longissimus]|uniref:protein zwilch homolog n=1 Tax=Lineus longissimus TaxID=88925 RepID=UPI002B4DA0D8